GPAELSPRPANCAWSLDASRRKGRHQPPPPPERRPGLVPFLVRTRRRGLFGQDEQDPQRIRLAREELRHAGFKDREDLKLHPVSGYVAAGDRDPARGLNRICAT